ncbi:amidohydrolase family protein [Nesterenkonia aerolata]|uniref:Amidohydrolase family protein n=1 Tax=Nesterenkonia aerolata TaxID=3074079 RepID=A0ABU2DT09_9MICC|nr:amidohydrolase family protein [Nesterenkonia sp. LY-0111]MDR8019632.1 amidohydrolase family protein [Nesterenkonia sp. LY-0111]
MTDGAEGSAGLIRPARYCDEASGQPVTVIPPLTDAHVHLSLAPLPPQGSQTLGRVLDLGGEPQFLADTAGRTATEVAFAGAFLTADGGYPSTRRWAPAGSLRGISTADQAHRAVAEQADAGAVVIKVALNSSAGPVLEDTTLKAVVCAARTRDLPVIAHAEGPGQAARALNAGVRALAHTPWTERLDDQLIEPMASRMIWISTLDMHRRDGDEQAWDTATENLKRFLRRGGRAIYGTDLGNGLQEPELHEPEVDTLLSLGHEAGLSAQRLLLMLTGVPLLSTHAAVATVLPADITHPAEVLAALPHARPVPVSALEELRP